MTTDTLTSIRSPLPFQQTVQRLLAAFTAHGVKIFATIDQQAEAAGAGLSMPPTTLIIFGNPKAGTALMLAKPESGIDLPLKVLVFETAPDQVTVCFNTPQYIIERHALPAPLLANLAPAANLIKNALQD